MGFRAMSSSLGERNCPSEAWESPIVGPLSCGDSLVKQPFGLVAGSVELQGGGVDADLGTHCPA